MNAVAHLVRLLPPATQLRLARQRAGRFDATPPVADAATCADLAAAVEARYHGDLAELLNACVGDDLDRLAAACDLRAAPVPAAHRQPALRAALWAWGAAAEAGGTDLIGTAIQPAPRVLGGRLVHHAPARGSHPPAASWPRPVPAPAVAAPPTDEPDSLDELLAAADRAIGVRLGPRGRDKGAWGGRAAALLGVVERGDDAPDWRGDVELKTIPVELDPRSLPLIPSEATSSPLNPSEATSPPLIPSEASRSEAESREGPATPLDAALAFGERFARGERSPDRSGGRTARGGWRIAEDPAIAMRGAAPIAKLQRVLWLVRAPVGADDATVLTWYLLEWDSVIARLVHRYLHTRPKGPGGTTGEAWYLHRRFFAEAGLLATLNGSGVTR